MPLRYKEYADRSNQISPLPRAARALKPIYTAGFSQTRWAGIVVALVAVRWQWHWQSPVASPGSMVSTRSSWWRAGCAGWLPVSGHRTHCRFVVISHPLPISSGLPACCWRASWQGCCSSSWASCGWGVLSSLSLIR